MQLTHRLILTGLPLGALAAGPAAAQTLDLTIAVPRLNVAEYHPPYVAIWLERAGAPARTLSVWYDTGKRNNAGTKWLRDVRMWWRASGRSLTLPADGVSGATRAPGTHKLSFTPTLAPGGYTLVVEAAREAGGRELVRLPFKLTPAGTFRASAKGSAELGQVTLTGRR